MGLKDGVRLREGMEGTYIRSSLSILNEMGLTTY